MQSPHGFIAEPLDGKLYDNVAKSGLILSTSIDSFQTTNRIAVIKVLPSGYSGVIQVDAHAIVHHNTFRKGLDMKGKEQFSTSYFEGDTYLVDPSTIYMYMNPDMKDWKTLGEWCFVAPVLNDNNLQTATLKDLHGTVVYGNDALDAQVGDEIVFITDSEYEFNIDEKILYRIESKDICLKKKQPES